MPDATTSEPAGRLRALLADEPPATVLALPDPSLTALADLLEESRRRQEADMGRAFNAALKHVPFPVRGIVKKVLLG
ncbi:hypothetical protein [uncultured Jatrophihabitans sp.]|uniref:hypothetical protein n=1 Tax=uncultured Jatrophihabitans sp. TaxID=1610747 RepID=UPI0035CA124B